MNSNEAQLLFEICSDPRVIWGLSRHRKSIVFDKKSMFYKSFDFLFDFVIDFWVQKRKENQDKIGKTWKNLGNPWKT